MQNHANIRRHILPQNGYGLLNMKYPYTFQPYQWSASNLSLSYEF